MCLYYFAAEFPNDDASDIVTDILTELSNHNER